MIGHVQSKGTLDQGRKPSKRSFLVLYRTRKHGNLQEFSARNIALRDRIKFRSASSPKKNEIKLSGVSSKGAKYSFLEPLIGSKAQRGARVKTFKICQILMEFTD